MMSVAECIVFESRFARPRVWSIIAAAEANSTHPIARALMTSAKIFASSDGSLTATDFESNAGRGISCRVNGASVLIGNADFLIENGIDIAEVRTRLLLF